MLSLAISHILLAGCGGDPDSQTCSLAEPSNGCAGGQVCELVGDQPACVAPVVVRGKVIDPAGAAIAGALVVALDANDAPATGTAVSGSDGAYELRVPVPRVSGGALTVRPIKLRASAAGFETFPAGLRRALPLELSAAQPLEGKLVLHNSATDITLFPVANSGGLGSIAGTVQGPPGKRGILVVAEGPGPVAMTAISDVQGSYRIFNVPAGAYMVRGYAAGLQFQPAMATVTSGARTDANLEPRAAALGTVSGSVSMVNAPGGSLTSVVLVVASTFNEAFKRGEVPPGLRAPRSGVPDVSGAFSITDVPDGEYLVLAAFENDGLVRDPDTSIGGTQIQRVSLGETNRQVALGASFKITEALAVLGPGAADGMEVVSGPPTFRWRDDSSEDRYSVELLDSRGLVVWRDDQVAKVTGGDVSVAYTGSLTAGQIYQFRATSIRKGGVPISQTEDLRGVFQAR